MIARLALACLVLGLAAAQQEIVIYTNGTGGVECGKFHRCYKDLSSCMIKEDNLQMCECNPGLEGNGKIACYREDSENLWVQNDPHCKNFYKEYSNLLTPCYYRLSHLEFLPTETTTAVVELFGENKLFKGGEYYLTRLILSIDLVAEGETMKQVLEFKGDVEGTYERPLYKFIAESIKAEGHPFDGSVDPSTIEDTPLFNYTMAVGKDEVNNLLKVNIYALGLELQFRPPSMARLENKLLPQVPGAVLNVDAEHWKMVDVDRMDFEISAWPQGPSLTEAARSFSDQIGRRVNKEQFVHYLLINNSWSAPEGLDDACYATQAIFQERCNTTIMQVEMMQVCSSIYADKTFLDCLSEKDAMGGDFNIQKDFFRQCELAFCTRDVMGCEKMKEEMPIQTSCPLPKKIQDMDCKNLPFPY